MLLGSGKNTKNTQLSILEARSWEIVVGEENTSLERTLSLGCIVMQVWIILDNSAMSTKSIVLISCWQEAKHGSAKVTVLSR